MKVHPPMTMQKPATAHTTTLVTGSLAPPTSVTSATSAPTNASASPSATHSMVMLIRLSSDSAPKPATTLRVGMMCATPQRTRRAAPR